ncbi:KAP family P-loop NTPase fold protein [Marinobacter shengliensis]|uniref:KAP family P-loop NTPase fold protein n=1 Tax=Marinobacter shengliensis TaxID=1389223 RepID=UPI001107E776|nr:P-loop NTPase fold protein [Marinobacter shengliensis]
MRFEPPELKIDQESPWSASAFPLSDTGQKLTHLVKGVEGPAVISLTSPWGTGKTTFLDMWAASLKKDKAKVVKFSAWEVDYTHDALVALIQELGSQLQAHQAKSPSFDKVRNKGLELVRTVTPFAVKIATSGLIDLEGVGELSKELVEKKLQAHESAKKSAEGFRDCLQKYAEDLQEVGNEFPLVIIVDELDRCRPRYAVELLESIKHFFNVPGVVFVIGIDGEQLGEAIKGHYGQGYDGHRYLRKFFHLQLRLPEPDLESFCANLLNKLGIKEGFDGLGRSSRSESSFPNDFIVNLARTYRLSLRDIERLMLEAGAIHAANPKFPPILAAPILWLLVQRYENPSLFDEATSKRLNSEALWKHIENDRKTLFRGSEDLEIRFRVIFTYLIEGKVGVGQLHRRAKEITEADGAKAPDSRYWGQIISKCLHFLEIDSQRDFMDDALSTMSLLGYRRLNDIYY